jgi:TonB family protein
MQTVRPLIAITMGFLIFGAALPTPVSAQDGDVDSPRKIINRAIPVYPELARQMHLEGTVKLQVTVAQNGTVKSVQAVGGSPLLVQAAENSVYKFRWIPAKQESKELVEMRFRPQ